VHEPGDFAYVEDARGLESLIRAARKQKPADLPFLIFIDVNLPIAIDLPPGQRPWKRDLDNALSLLTPPSRTNPELFNALSVRSFAYHFGDIETELAHP
jgi:hypothetical protein